MYLYLSSAALCLPLNMLCLPFSSLPPFFLLFFSLSLRRFLPSYLTACHVSLRKVSLLDRDLLSFAITWSFHFSSSSLRRVRKTLVSLVYSSRLFENWDRRMAVMLEQWNLLNNRRLTMIDRCEVFVSFCTFKYERI